ncbi:MAG: DUF6171 family protein [Coprococcus sp.]
MTESSQRFCRKCLLRETSEKEFYENLYTYIKNLPEEDRVSDEVYESRLSICRSCDDLLSGMCRRCGCYVELRAAMKIRSCPHVPAKWTSQIKAGGTDE